MCRGLAVHVAQRLLSWRRPDADHDEEDAYLLARNRDDRRRLTDASPSGGGGEAVATEEGVADGDQELRQGS